MAIFQVPVKGEITAVIRGFPVTLNSIVLVTIRADTNEDAALLALDALKVAECSDPTWHIDLDTVTQVPE